MGDPCIVVTTASGEEEFFFVEKPTFTYDSHTVKLSTSKTEIEYSPKDIISVKLDDRVNTGINTLKTEKNKVSFSFTDNNIVINGCEAGEQVSVFSVNGTVVAETIASYLGVADIPTLNLQNGIYIIKTKYSSFKFIKK